MLELQTDEETRSKENSKKERSDGNIRCKNGTLTLTKQMSELFKDFVTARESDSGVDLPSKERQSLRCWLYKAVMKLGATPVLRDDVFIGVISENQFEREAARWEFLEPSNNMGKEGKAVFHLRPLMMRFLASNCKPFQDDDTPLRMELVVARDENIAKD